MLNHSHFNHICIVNNPKFQKRRASQMCKCNGSPVAISKTILTSSGADRKFITLTKEINIL